MFDNLRLGPLVAVKKLDQKKKDFNYILSEGLIPIRFVEKKDITEDMMNQFEADSSVKDKENDFIINGVFITIYYTDLYQ